MRDLKLRYLIELISNIPRKAGDDAKALVDAQARVQEALSKTDRQISLVERALLRLGGVGSASAERQVAYLTKVAQSYERVRVAAGRYHDEMARGLQFGGQVGAGAAAAAAVAWPNLRAYRDLEGATQDLRIAMTNAKGQVSQDFNKISEETVKLGNQLPGTTKDFMLAARSLMTQGVPTSVVANGGLRASSYVGALLDLDQPRAAEVIAKLREAHGLKDNELVPMADLVQRAFFGFGIKPQDYLETAKYAAATFNTMGITGLEKTRQTLAIQGMAANVGLEASSFGTNYAQMLTRLAQIEPRLAKKSKEAKEARALLGEHGIEMSFYDDAGQFKGNENLLKQLAKLRALNPLEQTRILHTLFGVEGGRPAQILVQKGLEGYQSALATIGDQANLDSRLGMRMETFGAKLEALSGTIENVRAKIATQAGEGLKGPIDRMNDVLGGPVSGALDKSPWVGTAGMVGGMAGGAWAGARAVGALASMVGLGGAANGLLATGAGTVLAAGLPVVAAGGLAAAGGGLAGTLLYDKVLAGTTAGDKIGELAAIVWSMFGSAEAKAALAANGVSFGTPTYKPAAGAPSIYAGADEWAAYRAAQAAAARRAQGGAVGGDVWAGVGAPGGAAAVAAVPTVKVGEGTLRVDIAIKDERVTATTTVQAQPNLLRIAPGATNPAGYEARR